MIRAARRVSRPSLAVRSVLHPNQETFRSFPPDLTLQLVEIRVEIVEDFLRHLSRRLISGCGAGRSCARVNSLGPPSLKSQKIITPTFNYHRLAAALARPVCAPEYSTVRYDNERENFVTQTHITRTANESAGSVEEAARAYNPPSCPHSSSALVSGTDPKHDADGRWKRFLFRLQTMRD